MDKELIEHIATQLQNHEENYTPGAWERFSEKEEKERSGFVLWPLWTAAAIILMFSGIFFFTDGGKSQGEKIVKSTNQTKEISSHNQIENKLAKVKEQSKTRINKSQRKSGSFENKFTPNSVYIEHVSNKVDGLISSNELSSTENSLLATLGNDITLVSAKDNYLEISLEQSKPKPTNRKTFEDILALDSKFNQQQHTNTKLTKSSKWEQDVYVAPSMGNDSKVNMNYGFSLSYALANKLFISSGVSYASLSSTDSQNASAPVNLSGKNLASVDAKVSGINVPLELRYSITDKLYTGVGISALAVLNNSQQNTYLVNQLQTMSSPSANGLMDQKSYFVAEMQSEPQPESTIDPDKYIGFYNFSLGYKQKLSKKNNIAIEPFLRLPMKTFSRENLNLTNGGLRLKIAF